MFQLQLPEQPWVSVERVFGACSLQEMGCESVQYSVLRHAVNLQQIMVFNFFIELGLK